VTIVPIFGFVEREGTKVCAVAVWCDERG
jgi:hypothetical protein